MSELTDYGFTFGASEVIRACEINGAVTIMVKTEHHSLQIGVSPKGRSIRVWKDHKEMK